MKTIDPEKDSCENWKLDNIDLGKGIHKGIEYDKRCCFCYYNLFACCWFSERKKSVVIRALQGNHEARQKLHQRLKK